MDSSCSSGRQSRAYFAWWTYFSSIPKYYQYFENKSLGGRPSADYCPVAMGYSEEKENGYYVGNCLKGFEDYGIKIYYNQNGSRISFKSDEIKEITGEIYSNHSFCYLSSLTKKK